MDLWIHYLNHVKTVLTEPEEVRAVYERALGQCGREWKSDKIWDNFVKWEQVRNIVISYLSKYLSTFNSSGERI